MPIAPAAPRHPVTTVRHGESFTDDFAWLRDRNDPATVAYLEAENRYAEAVLAPTEPLQQRLYDEMVGRIKETDLSVPVKRDDYWYYTRTEQGLQYGIHCRRAHRMADGPEEVLLDLNDLARDKPFMALGDFAVNDDATLLAYSTDDTGFRQYTLVIKDLTTGKLLDFAQERVTSVAWTTDGRQLFYTVEDAVTKRSHQLWRHDMQGAADDPGLYGVGRGLFRARAAHAQPGVAVVARRQSHHVGMSCPPRACRRGRLATPVAAPPGHRVRRRTFHLARESGTAARHVPHPDQRYRSQLSHCRGAGGRRPDGDAAGTGCPPLRRHDRESDCFARYLVVSEREGGVPQLAVARVDGPGFQRLAFPEPVYEAYLHANPEWDVDTIRIGYQSLVTPASVFECNLATR